jgi:hypothetical protein
VTVNKEAVEERSTVAEELKLLREERKRNEEMVAELKKLLQEREQIGKTAASDQKGKLELETKLKEAQKDSKVTEEVMASRIKELESKLSSAEERTRKESQLASIPLGVGDKGFRRISLRSVPTGLAPQDLKSMIEKYNSPVQPSNPKGQFQREYVDNGDGTISDKVTGLMWQKGGSQSDVTFSTAQKHVQDFNEKRFGGHREWRLPTVEELCSLLKAEPNNEKLHIDRLFESVQRACWSSDLSAQSVQSGGHRSRSAFVVDFAMGDLRIDGADVWSQTRRYVRAVRTIE